MSLRILLLGGGGREAALAWRLSISPSCGDLLIAPGNAGMEAWGRRIPALDILDAPGVVACCHQEGVDLVVVGPEQPLVMGLVDALQAAGIPAFGPTRLAAELEGSKAWAKAFMARHAIPTADFRVFTSAVEALAFLEEAPWPVVIKASGLAAGKGVLLPETPAEARDGVVAMLAGGAFGEAGSTIVIEERLEGPELSVFALCDGRRGWIFGSARDHKRVGEGDRGPNTGGMGAVAPGPQATPQLLEEIQRLVLEPVLAGMAKEGRPFSGVLFMGLMLTRGGPRVMEFNCRFGDPETQALMPALDERVDLAQLMHQVANGEGLPMNLPREALSGAAVCVVLAAEGYPGPVKTGDVVVGLEALGRDPRLQVFVAGATPGAEGRLVSAGGRVLGLTARGADSEEARALALAAMSRLRMRGGHYRKDIGA